MSYPILIYTT